LAREVGVDMAQIVRLEKGDVATPKVETLARIAKTLGLPLADVYGLAGYETTAELPSFTPYLRTKYRELPDEAVAEMEAFLDRLRAKHGLTGPVDHEDE
jgi:transcriptional regulator with XRE-family HTH domain